MLFLSHRFILIKPPNTFVTIAKNNAIKVTIRLHALNDLLKLPTEYVSDRFLSTKRFLAMSLFTSAFQRVSRMVTSLFDDATMSSRFMPSSVADPGCLDSAF